jgi:hypothetical protein
MEAYHQIKDSGMLRKLQWEVYRTLFQYGPLTQLETVRFINRPDIQDRSILPRFAELARMGVIEAVGKVRCKISENTVYQYDVTSNLPKKVKRLTKDDQIKILTAENAALNAELNRLKGGSKQSFFKSVMSIFD